MGAWWVQNRIFLEMKSKRSLNIYFDDLGIRSGVYRKYYKWEVTKKMELPVEEEFLFGVAKGCRNIVMHNWRLEVNSIEVLEVRERDNATRVQVSGMLANRHVTG